MRDKKIYATPRAESVRRTRTERPARHRHPVLRVLPLLLPLVLVNAAAVWGQAGWAYERVTPRLVTEVTARIVLSLLFALSIESIGVYLSWEAHMARMNNEAAGLLQGGAYAVGALAGWLNFDHWHQPGGDNSAAVVFALLSAISPWLWAVWSRARNRARLAELGMTDPRGVKLSTSRKFWHPVRSIKVVRWAAWSGEVNPTRAVAGWERTRLPAGPRVSLVKTRPAVTVTDVDARIAAAIAPVLRAAEARKVRPAPRPAPPVVDPVPASPEVRERAAEDVVRGLEARRQREADAVTYVRTLTAGGAPPTAAEVGRRYGLSEAWGQKIKTRAKEESPNGRPVPAPQ